MKFLLESNTFAFYATQIPIWEVAFEDMSETNIPWTLSTEKYSVF